MKGKEQEFEAATTTPGNPGRVYVLDWEAQDQRRVPVQPLHWRMDYDKGADGKRQVSVRQERVRGGQWAARFELRKSDPIVGGYTRCELSAEVETRGDKQWYERWYGFSIYLPDTWTDDQQAEIVTQWHHYDDGYAPGSTEYAKFYGGSPPLSILTKNGEWNIGSRYKWDNRENSDARLIPAKTRGENGNEIPATYETDKWTDWVVHVVWSPHSQDGEGRRAGLLEIWKNGMPVILPSDIANGQTKFDDGRGNYMKIGIYKWRWSEGDPPPGHPPYPTQRIMYHDEVRIADQSGRYETVVPRGDTPTKKQPDVWVAPSPHGRWRRLYDYTVRAIDVDTGEDVPGAVTIYQPPIPGGTVTKGLRTNQAFRFAFQRRYRPPNDPEYPVIVVVPDDATRYESVELSLAPPP